MDTISSGRGNDNRNRRPLQYEPAIVAAAHLATVEDLLDGDGIDLDSFQFEATAQPVATPGRIHQADIQYALFTSGGMVAGWE